MDRHILNSLYSKLLMLLFPFYLYFNYYITDCQYFDCKDAYQKGQTTSGIYTIKPDNQTAFQVYCDMDTDGGGWTVFQRRMDGSVNFYRNWTDYEQGFGNLSGEYWLGLRKIHHLTPNNISQELRVDLVDIENKTYYAHYDNFGVAGASDKYRLHVSGYNGTAGDSLAFYHSGYQFSTPDQDNDALSYSCAQYWKGAWWYRSCWHSNLNGRYTDLTRWNRYIRNNLKMTAMMLRRK